MYISISPLLLKFFFHIGHYRVLNRVPCAYSRSLLIIYFIFNSMERVHMNLSTKQK